MKPSTGFAWFGGIDFSGAREPLSNLWTAIGSEHSGRLRIRSVRPHAFRADLATYVVEGWRNGQEGDAGPILWGADFPFGLPAAIGDSLVPGGDWERILEWVADRPPDEVRSVAGDAGRSLRRTDGGGALPPLDLRLYKQTVEGFRWLYELREEREVCIRPQAPRADASVTLIEVYPSATSHELGMPRRRAPGRPGEVRARAAALRTFMDFEDANCEALVVTLEDAWDAAIACLTAFLCRDDLDQPERLAPPHEDAVAREGWIYRPPATLS